MVNKLAVLSMHAVRCEDATCREHVILGMHADRREDTTSRKYVIIREDTMVREFVVLCEEAIGGNYDDRSKVTTGDKQASVHEEELLFHLHRGCSVHKHKAP